LQCQILSLPRSTLYYQPQAVSSEELALMRLLDEEYLKHPFFGSRKMADALCRAAESRRASAHRPTA
jgi:putative transposase